MPPSHRSRRQSHDSDDYEDDDMQDAGTSRQAGQEKMKQLALDLVGRWHWIALGLILGVLGGFFYLSKAPKIYQARATLLIKQQTSTVMSRDQVDEMDLRSLEGLNTVAERITRPELLQKVASRPEVRALPGLMPRQVEWLPDWALPWFGKTKVDTATHEAPPPAASLAGAIASWTKISVRRGTRLLDVLISHPSPEVAKTLADGICVEYQKELTGARSSGRKDSLQILVTESESARTRLQTAQNAMATYQRALITLKDLEARETTAAELSRRYLPKHPKMISAQAELESFQQRFLSEFNAARTSTADREYWDKNAVEWQQTGANEPAKLLTARRLLLARGNVLESEIGSQTSVFNSILTRIQEADINQLSDESEMEISSSAQLPGGPISPVRNKVLGMASLGGLGFGILLAMFFIRLDNKIHTVSQLERETGLPALAAIADIPVKVVAGAVRKNKGESTAISEARERWNPLLLFREGVSSTTFAEMFRVLRASVSLLGDEKKRRVTLFSSALPGEGKTLVSSNFALAAASQGKRTLLIDLDLRKPAVHKAFGLKRDSHAMGTTEVLSGQAAFAEGIYTDTGAENLHIMLAGKQAPNPGELLNASSLQEFLDSALALYDLVVIDSAPLLAVPDTRIIAAHSDNFCLVVRASFVSKGAVRRVISMLDHDDNLPSGVVLNGFSEKRRLMGQNYSYGNYQTNKYGKAYRYGYGSYGSYGSDSEK
ncbi:MAG: polysaccharide biosynthesis tyrosine autokinase [Verrucomicrobiota bacterium]